MKIVLVIFLACVLLGCNLRPSIRGNEGSLQTKAEAAEEVIPSDQAVDFEGVSFHYDPRVFGDVKKEIVPEHKLERPDNKPDNVVPEGVEFEFEFGREHGTKARIAIYPLDKFDDAYAISPEMAQYINDEITGLRRVLKNPSSRLKGQIPHLELGDGSDDFYVKVRGFDFPGGRGIIFITHWSIEAELLSNRNLVYRYEGITADGKFYVTAETPVSVAFLPDEMPTAFEGYTYENLFEENSNSKDTEARIEKYRNSITTRLEKLNSSDYSPSLEKFEEIISSLRINK
ncbi:MAG: hypothetical protein DMF63_09020 [Acidobacteria bacterium]|nr:MAG: hypothetical protein DMF63_09020 [Acidobacteriota bacterium]